MGVIGGIGRVLAYGAKSAAKSVGKAAWAGTKMAGKGALIAADKAAIGTAKVVGKTAEVTSGVVTGVGRNAWRARNNTKGANIIGTALNDTKAAVRGMGHWEGAKDVYNPITGKVKHTDSHFALGKFGKAAIFGPAAAAGVLGAGDAYMDNRVGAIDGNVVTATPIVGGNSASGSPSYANNGGATGDLVFAMHNNRFG